MYAPQDGQIQVHQNRVAPCPAEIPAGFFWYDSRRSGPGRPPKWVDHLLRGDVYSPPEPVTEEESPESHITVQDVPETSETEKSSHEPASELSELPFPEEFDHDRREVEGSPSDTLPQQDGEDTVMRPKRSQDSETGALSSPTFGSSATENQDSGSQPAGQRYSLWKRRPPPQTLMLITSRTSFSGGGDDVTRMNCHYCIRMRVRVC